MDVVVALPMFLNGSDGADKARCPLAGAGDGYDGAEAAESALVLLLWELMFVCESLLVREVPVPWALPGGIMVQVLGWLSVSLWEPVAACWRR